MWERSNGADPARFGWVASRQALCDDPSATRRSSTLRRAPAVRRERAAATPLQMRQWQG